MSHKVDASPTKEFFVRMITRDITLEDCILDLLDNCLDGARKDLQRGNALQASAARYNRYWARIRINGNAFVIEDNCGGISIQEAINYAFHFGRRPDEPTEGDFGIGLYGIGMKRAIFKLGNHSEVRSSSGKQAFRVIIDVNQWLARPNEWDFDLEEIKPWSPGTIIEVRQLNDGIASEFVDTVFQNRLRDVIGRDYSFFLQEGFSVYLNDNPVVPYHFALRTSDVFKPVRYLYDDESGVRIEIIAGMAGLPPDDISPDAPVVPNAEYYGWFVACNDRIVLVGDKTKSTVWGDEFPAWHFQYNGFMGIVNFRSPDPVLLPWTTTKREIDLQSPVYRRAINHMKKATRSYIDYTNARKEDLERAKTFEAAAQARRVQELPERESVAVPQLTRKPRVEMANVTYAVSKDHALKAATALGNRNLHYKQIGLKTFEYYYKNEVGEDE